ncbi:histamine H2 receptor-like [Amphiura filiformis]|uniref:histamine H2 receptor-like n=1 Tax=Amphiura filiformis TaxID=82378 RepID=UPI003B223F00
MELLNSFAGDVRSQTTLDRNSSDDDDYDTDDQPPSVAAIRASFIIITVLLAIFANILCLVVLPHTRNRIPENNRLLMMSLSAADLGIGFITALSIAPAILGHWPYGTIICNLSSSLNNAFSGISILSLVLISLDRYVAVTKPLRYVVIVTRKKVIIVIAILWAFELVFCSVVFAFTGAPIKYDHTVAKCTPVWRPGKDTPMLLVTLTLTIVIPFLMMIFIYTRLFLIAQVQIKKMRHLRSLGSREGDRNGVSISTHSDRKASRTFFVITLVFAFSWLPYTISAFYSNISGHSPNKVVQFLAVWVIISSSWSDVLVFAGMNSSFRLAAKRLFKCMRRNSRVLDSNMPVISKETAFNNEHSQKSLPNVG